MSYNLPPDPDEPAGPPQPLRRRPTRARALVLTLLVLAVLVIAYWVFAGFYTDLLWYRSVGYASVFQTRLKTEVLMFVLFGGVMAGAVALNCWLAYRARPAFRGVSAEQQGLDRYRVAVDPFRRVLVIAVALALGLITGGSASGQWQTALMFFNSQPFHAKDAQFGLDLSFFMFRLPFWEFLIGFGFGVVIVSLVAAVLVHYLYGGLRLQTPGEKTTPAARAHIAVLLGLFVLMKAASYWFDRYALVTKDGPRISGGSYTDINALLPAKLILFCIAIICAILFFATIVTRNWLAPALGFGLLVVSAVVIGGIYPFFVQSVQVRPSEPDKEAPYIQRNIDATSRAYLLNSIQSQDYGATTNVKEQVSAALPTVTNVRLIDPAVVSQTFKQLQQLRGFYSFADTLDVDRYPVTDASGASSEREAVVAVRELDLTGIPSGQNNFANDHTVYTHGFGFVAAYGNQPDDKGNPTFFESAIPPKGLIDISQPRIYFGENSPDYSIVGAPASKAPVEFDYNTTNAQVNNTYTGSGGVPMGSLIDRVLFATKFGDTNILLSDRVNSDSRIMWNRDPRQRVQAVAPWLTLDGDAYPAVVGGRIVWIVDAYTTSNGYPYSQRTTLGDVTADSVTVRSNSIASQPPDQVNYIRNSVKAVVDAYDGTVRLYEWDKTDPVLRMWENAFPGTVTPYDQIPTALMPHLRYPQDLFKVQRDLYAKYHITDPKAFYSGQDFWKVPDDPTKPDSGQAQPPYYLTVQMPGQNSPSFSLTTTFAPNNRINLAAFMAVDSDPGADYGTIRVLQMPKSTNVPGPGQIQTQFETDPVISSQLTLLRNGGSQVVFGNLLSLPVAGTLIYVEPVYITASSGTTYPLLRKVLVSFGTNVAMADTLAQGLAVVLNTTGVPGPTPTPTTTTPPPTTGGSAALQAALARADKALQDENTALSNHDFAAYGAAQARLAAAIADAVRLAAAGAKVPTASPSPSPTSSPTSTPTSTASP